MDSLSDTPETDAEAVCRAGPGEWLEVVTTDFAKELERSRNEWRRQATENEHKRWLLEQILADVQTRLCGAVESEQRAYIAGLEKAAEICAARSEKFYERMPAYATGARECAEELRALAATLPKEPAVPEGWEPVGVGNTWSDYRCKRCGKVITI